GEGRLPVRRDGVDIGRVGGEGDLDAAADGLVLELGEQVAGPLGAARLQHAGERVEPFARFAWVVIAVARRGDVRRHENAPWKAVAWLSEGITIGGRQKERVPSTEYAVWADGTGLSGRGLSDGLKGPRPGAWDRGGARGAGPERAVRRSPLVGT